MLAQLFDPSGDGDQQGLRVDERQFSRVVLERMRRVDLLEDARRVFKALDVRAQGFLSLQSFQAVRLLRPLRQYGALEAPDEARGARRCARRRSRTSRPRPCLAPSRKPTETETAA